MTLRMATKRDIGFSWAASVQGRNPWMQSAGKGYGGVH
jgi:hypothetical protein